MSQNTDQIVASRPAYVKPFNGVASVETARQKRPANYKIDNVSDAFAIVEIYDEIGGWGVWACELIPLLREIDGPGRTIEFRINSGGGDVFEGLAIANAIKFMDARTVAVVYGLAASIASVITVACDEVRMPTNSMMMIHRPHMILWGEAEDLRKGAALLDTIEQQLINTYADRATETPREQIAEMVAAETWMTAAEAIALGFADTLIQDIRMAASASMSIEAKAAPAEAAALLAGPVIIEQETAVSDTAAEEAPVVSAETEVVTAEAVEPVAEVADEAPVAESEAAPVAEITETPAASTDQEISAEPDTSDAKDGYPPQEAQEPIVIEPVNEEAIAIRAACAVLDASDKADGFIRAGMNFEQVRKALWDHRVAAAARNEISTQGSALLAENPVAAPAAQPSEGPSALKLAYAARKGRTK